MLKTIPEDHTNISKVFFLDLLPKNDTILQDFGSIKENLMTSNSSDCAQNC